MNQRYDLYGSQSTSPAITGNEEYVDPDTVRTFKFQEMLLLLMEERLS